MRRSLLCFLFLTAAINAESMSFRDVALDHPSLKTTALKCSALPQYRCFANPSNKIAHITKNVSSDPGDCCELCMKNEQCASWNHGHAKGGYSCDLYTNVGEQVTRLG